MGASINIVHLSKFLKTNYFVEALPETTITLGEEFHWTSISLKVMVQESKSSV